MSCPYFLLEPGEENMDSMLRNGEAAFSDLKMNYDTTEEFVLDNISDISKWVEDHVECLDMSKLHYKDVIISEFDEIGYASASRLEGSAFGWETKQFFEHVKKFESERRQIQEFLYTKKSIDVMEANKLAIVMITKYNLNYTTQEMRDNAFEKLEEDFEEGFNMDEIHEIYNNSIRESGDQEIFNHIYKLYCEEYVVDSDLKVGDICLLVSQYESRPEYGISIVGYDERNNNKTLVTDSEGTPNLPDNIITKLKVRNVTYNNVNKKLNELFGLTDAVLVPPISLRIMGGAPM